MSKSNVPIVVAGTFFSIGVAILSVLSVKAVLTKLNKDADIVYAEDVLRYVDARHHDTETQTKETATENVSDSEQAVTQISDYSSEDLVQMDGQWYVSADLVSQQSVPLTVDTEDMITVGGEQYMKIDTPVEQGDSSSDGYSGPFYGLEYVVVDIDGNMVYLVEKGDTLSDVSGRIGYSVQELAEFNAIQNVNMIYEGQTIRIPASQRSIDFVSAAKQGTAPEAVDTQETVAEESSVVMDDVMGDTEDDNEVLQDASEDLEELEGDAESVADDAVMESKPSPSIGIGIGIHSGTSSDGN